MVIVVQALGLHTGALEAACSELVDKLHLQ